MIRDFRRTTLNKRSCNRRLIRVSTFTSPFAISAVTSAPLSGDPPPSSGSGILVNSLLTDSDSTPTPRPSILPAGSIYFGGGTPPHSAPISWRKSSRQPKDAFGLASDGRK